MRLSEWIDPTTHCTISERYTTKQNVNLFIFNNPYTYIYTYIHTHTNTHTQTHIHTHIHTYTHKHTHTNTHTYTHTYIHTQTHTHTNTHNTHIHTYIHKHISGSLFKPVLYVYSKDQSPTPYRPNRKHNVLNTSLTKPVPSFLPSKINATQSGNKLIHVLRTQ